MDAIAKPPSVWRADLNGDARFTMGDVGLWLQEAFFVPGDWLLWTTATYAPPVAEFLEIGAADYGGLLSGFVSTLAWLTLLIFVGIFYNALRNFDRALTEGSGRLYAEGGRRVRIAAKLLAYRLRRKPVAAAQADVIEFREETELTKNELRVLRLFVELRPGYALAVSEVAAALELRGEEARLALARLKQLNLVDSTVGGLEGESAYVLTRAGRAFLTFQQLRET